MTVFKSILVFLKNNFIYLCIHLFWAVWDLCYCFGFPLVAVIRGYCVLAVCRLLIVLAPLVVHRHAGFSSRGTGAQ